MNRLRHTDELVGFLVLLSVLVLLGAILDTPHLAERLMGVLAGTGPGAQNAARKKEAS